MVATVQPRGWSAWRVYLAERFPVPVTLLLALATGAAAYAVAQAPVAGLPLVVDGAAFGGVGLMFLLLFHLRVFDEHKDFAEDAATRPDRPVQRGLVTLRQLSIAGAVAIALELVLALAPGWRAGWWWALPLGYSVLMLREFFAPRWLARHYTIYAISHSAITSLVCVALVLRFTVRAGLTPGIELAVLAFLGLASTFAIDVLRKTWHPGSEIEGVASWSKQLGVRPAAALGASLLVLAGLAGAWLGWQVGGRLVWLGVAAAVTAWGLFEIRRFAVAPSARGEKTLQVVAGVHYLVIWLGIAVAAIAAKGVWLTAFGLDLAAWTRAPW
jgi:hypothetical protein